jgi:hypothetical protein
MDTTDQGMNGDGLRVAVGHLDADETLASQSNLDERRVWKRAEFDISNWAGSPDLHVLFVAATNAVAPTSFFIDDVSLIACSVATATSSPTAPSPTATALPTGTASPTTASPPSPSPSLTSSPSPSASASRTSTATSSPTTRPSVTPTGSPTPPAYCANDDFEPNDTIAQAAPLLPDIEYQLRLCPSEEFDHFRIAVPAGQRFVVRVAPTGEQNVALTLFDATGIFLDHADRYGAGSPYIAETLTGRSASAALYVVRVSAPTTAQPMPGQGGAGVLYRITVRLGDLDLWVEPSVNRPGGAAALVGQGLGAAAGPTPCDLVVHSGAPDGRLSPRTAPSACLSKSPATLSKGLTS